ncbi:MAG TPA: hypothetical protein VFU02_21920, partial [Polyangiaceae bacterium]|nr:hypothetical protein [Polyangiaceae bacterium]
MPSAIRVVMHPTVESFDWGLKITAVEVALQRFGAGQSQAAVDEPKDAKLTFFGGYMDAARNKTGPEQFAKLAWLRGKLSLTRGGKPTFECSPGAALEVAPDFRPGKGVNLTFSSASFKGAPAAGENGPLRLHMPFPPDTARFFEFAAELEVSGSVESGHLVNDRLDVTLPTFVAVRLVDEAGTPLAGKPYLIICPSGDRYEGETDAQGVARVNGIDPGEAQVGVRQLPPEQAEAETGEVPEPGTGPGVATDAAVPPAPASELSFVEIKLLDDAGNPCVGAAYELVTASGETLSGTLDDDGYA